MEKMISPNGVKANMCCASCKYLSYKTVGLGIRGIKRWCGKKNAVIFNGARSCSYYTTAEFFQKGGYKAIKD